MSTPRVANGDAEIQPFIRVRHAVAEKIEERLASSKPLLISSLSFNLAFVVAPFSVLVLSRHEKAPVSMRFWVVVYALQVLLHMWCIFKKYHNRRRHRPAAAEGGGEENPADFDLEYLKARDRTSRFAWWMVGLLILDIKQNLRDDRAPQLCWLCVVLLGIDTFHFVVYFIVFEMALFFCLPCIIAILHAVADDEDGAKNEDIQRLRNFKFRSTDRIMRECDTDSPVEYVIPAKDAECLICLNAYDDEAELRQLPCRHHFHTACVDKWLHISATCPLCKLDIGNCNDGDQKGVMREHVFPVEDAECCICLNTYDDGAEVRELPCRHQFHTACVDKWLHINATCPLCKFNIGNQNDGDDQV